MPFDPTNKAHKKQLYPVLRALSDLNPRTSPELLIDQACGRPLARGTDYIKNVAKGDFAKSIALLVYEYLRDHNFDIAHKVSPDIFPETPAMRWQQIIEEKAITGCLKIVLVKSTMGLVTRDSDLEIADRTIAFGRRFLFELNVQQKCHCVALQGIGDTWHPIQLGEMGQNTIALDLGTSSLPRLANGLPDPLSEETHAGLHNFIFITSQAVNIPIEIHKLNSWVFANECEIHRVTVLFVE